MKPKVFGYMKWHSRDVIVGFQTTTPEHPLDGTDMVLCVDKMVEKGDWIKFYRMNLTDYSELHLSECKLWSDGFHADFVSWLFQPDHFFLLMEKWLEEGSK
jgi:hypothetical protein